MSSVSRHARFAFAFGAFLVSGCASADQELCSSSPATYKYPGAEAPGYRFDAGQWWVINVGSGPHNNGITPNRLEPTYPYDKTKPIIDCSTDSSWCVQAHRWVFAIPKGKFTEGETYDVAGAHLWIQSCARGPTEPCETALVISDCSSSSGAHCAAKERGEKIYFIFNRTRGVVGFEQAFDTAGADITKVDLKTLPESDGVLALVESKGLLSCESASELYSSLGGTVP